VRCWRQLGLHPLFQFAARDHHVAPALLALEADVGPQPGDGPFVTAAGVRFAQTQSLAQSKFYRRRHRGDYSRGAGDIIASVAQASDLRFDYFSRDANDVAAYAYGTARLYGHQAVDVEHFALALFEKPGPVLPQIFSDMALNPQNISDRLDSLVQALPVQPAQSPDKIYITVKTKSLIDLAGDESHHLREDKINNVHLLLALVADSSSPAAHALTEAGLNRKRVLQAYKRSSFYAPQSEARAPRPNPAASFQSRLNDTTATLKESLSRVRGLELSQLPVTVSLVFIVALSLTVVAGLLTYLLSGVNIAAQMALIVFVVSGWFVTLALHEFGHALAAYYGGDWSVTGTAYFNLNPFKYTHIWISFILPALFFLIGGIGLPGMPVFVGFHNIADRRRRSLAWAGGPIASLACGLIFALPFALRIVQAPQDHLEFWSGLTSLATLQFIALLFCLIPLPGFDGFGILEPYLPPTILYYAERIRPYVFFIFVFLFLFPTPIRQLFYLILGVILWIVGLNPFPPVFGLGLLR